MSYNYSTGEYVYIPPVEPETKSSQAILGDGAAEEPGLLDDALTEFLSKNDDYEDASDALGLTGQTADLWRKIVKLKKVIIDGGHLNGETVSQLIRDIFGHSLLAMYYDDNRKPAVKTQARSVQQEVVNAEAPEPAGLNIRPGSPGYVLLQRIKDNAAAIIDEGGTWDQIQAAVAAARIDHSPEEPVVDVGAKSPLQARAITHLRMAVKEAREFDASSDQMEAIIWDEFHSEKPAF